VRRNAGGRKTAVAEEVRKDISRETPKQWLTLSSKPNSMFLFGDFLVRDRNGEIISSAFTTRQRQMFCLALQRGEEGISSKRLSSLLWPDATEEQAKNSRGVNISNLRKALRNLDDVAFVYDGGRFRIESGPGFYCDYIRCYEIMASKNPDYAELSAILSGGRFLRFTQDPIFDDFKLKVESELVNFLSAEMERRFEAQNYDGTADIAGSIFMVEPLNERALELGIKSLKERRRTAEAVEMYSAFAAEYKICYDSDCPIKINEL